MTMSSLINWNMMQIYFIEHLKIADNLKRRAKTVVHSITLSSRELDLGLG